VFGEEGWQAFYVLVVDGGEGGAGAAGVGEGGLEGGVVEGEGVLGEFYGHGVFRFDVD